MEGPSLDRWSVEDQDLLPQTMNILADAVKTFFRLESGNFDCVVEVASKPKLVRRRRINCSRAQNLHPNIDQLRALH
jgi:hypothetical protein